MIAAIFRNASLFAQVLMATGPGIHRKPAVGMWTYILNKANDGIAVDMTTSLYCGGKLYLRYCTVREPHHSFDLNSDY